ncbi:MAG TPA: ACT domain-containing protein [Drouetiella sp.]
MTKPYTKNALDEIAQSNFEVQPGNFIYAKVSSVDMSADHFLVSRDADEITVVTTEDKLSSLDLIEKNKDTYRLIALNVSVPFYSVGFLATVCDALASCGMNVLVASTYSRDYVLVRADLVEKATAVLLSLGFDEL